MLKDSGERRIFQTGAMRDITDGKGRCDLLPLDVVSMFYAYPLCDAFQSIEIFKNTKDCSYLMKAIEFFIEYYNLNRQFVFLEVSKHYEEGAKKYSENNWMKGIPLHCYIDSGVRHLLKHIRGDTDEPHDRAFVWNMFGAIWTIIHRPELDDIMVDLYEE